MGYIYLVTNLINDKHYIGQTNFTIKKRWEQHQYDAFIKQDDFYFHRALRKYGIDNFKIEPLIECGQEELDEKEIYYIDYYKSYYIYKQGYNLTRGGKGNAKINVKETLKLWNQGFSAIEIARQFNLYIRTVTDTLKLNGISQQEIYHRSMKYGAKSRYKKIYQYDFNGNLINIFSDLNEMTNLTGYRKDYISAACRHTYPSANGYLWIYEDEEKTIEELLKKIPPENNHPVLQYDLSGNLIQEFFSFREAAKKTNIDATLISRAAKNNSLTAGSFIWVEKDQNFSIKDKLILVNNQHQNKKKKIGQYDLNNNLIQIFNSITEASKAIGKENCRSSIGKVCQGKQKTSCGYIWKYIE